MATHLNLPKTLSASIAAAVLLLSGCATPPPPATAAAAPAVAPLQQYMQEAGQAASDGSKDRARDLYRTAAKTYPTSKEPWVKLAEDYFDTANYGQAILASQEVLQRDPADSVATSVLAVSGLRVSSSALAMLRQQQRPLNGGTKTEAEDLAKVLRDALGEPVLVPRTTAKNAPVRKRVAPATAAASGVGVSASTSVATVTPADVGHAAPTAKADPANPFNVLKK